MDSKDFNSVLDYGLFQEDDQNPPLEIPKDVDWENFKFFSKVKIINGKTILFRSRFSSIRPNEGDIGFLNGTRIMEGRYELSMGHWIILVENGFFSKWLRREQYRDKWKKINFEIETVYPYGVQIGSPVFIDGKPAPDGKYYKGRFSSIGVMDGVVDKF